MVHTQATEFDHIAAAVNFTETIAGVEDPFYTDFKGLRGDFRVQRLYKHLGYNPNTKTYTPTSDTSKKFVFLAGMPGSGKTTELAVIADEVQQAKAFLPVVCNIDQHLDMNNVEYMDVLIFQLERLVAAAQAANLTLDDSVIQDMQRWFGEQVEEVNKKLEDSLQLEVGAKVQTGIPGLFNLFTTLRGGMKNVHEQATKIRAVLRNRFSDLMAASNAFLAEVNQKLAETGKAQEILFLIDGLEKTYTHETRRKLVIDEGNRLVSLKAHTIFTLPIALFHEEQKLKQLGDVQVWVFPFIKLIERNGDAAATAYAKFEEFITKRIAPALFASPAVLRQIITYSGGSPREVLRIIKEAWLDADDETQITEGLVKQAIRRLGNEMTRHLPVDEWDIVKRVAQRNQDGKDISFEEGMGPLFENENLIIMEYNDGTYKRVHPIVKASKLYQEYGAPQS